MKTNQKTRAVVDIFFSIQHVNIILSWRWHECQHNSSFKIGWNTDLFIIMQHFGHNVSFFKIQNSNHRPLHFLKWSLIVFLFFHCSPVIYWKLYQYVGICCVDINVNKHCVNHGPTRKKNKQTNKQINMSNQYLYCSFFWSTCHNHSTSKLC